MPNEERPLSAYDFNLAGGANNTYMFSTTRGYWYEISFKPSGYIFPQSAAFQHDVFAFIITLTNGQSGALPSADPLIEPTIVLIFQDFFARRGAVVVYICDSTDQRQAIRHRMFNQWFLRY